MLEQVKNYVANNKENVLTLLGIVISVLLEIQYVGGNVGIICAIFVIGLRAVIEFIKNGLTDTFIDILATAVKLIIDVIKSSEEVADETDTESVEDEEIGSDSDEVEEAVDEIGAVSVALGKNKNKSVSLSVDDIKEILKQNI